MYLYKAIKNHKIQRNRKKDWEKYRGRSFSFVFSSTFLREVSTFSLFSNCSIKTKSLKTNSLSLSSSSGDVFSNFSLSYTCHTGIKTLNVHRKKKKQSFFFPTDDKAKLFVLLSLSSAAREERKSFAFSFSPLSSVGLKRPNNSQLQIDRKTVSFATKDLPQVFWNLSFNKGILKNFVFWCFVNYGQRETIKILEKLQIIGFGYATKAGISLSIDDLKIPPTKAMLLADADKSIEAGFLSYKKSQLTGLERFQRIIETWHKTSENLKDEMINNFRQTDSLNPVYMMAFSGARGNISQVRQLVAMRGLMSDPQGKILSFPIRSNFREGLTLTEYVISCYGARKGVVDTALRTANAGYLTRRLVDVAQHVIVLNFDCGTKKGFYLTEMKKFNKTLYPLRQRLLGRVLAAHLYNSNPVFPKKRIETEELKIIARRNQEISEPLADKISKITNKVFIRSPLTCDTPRLVCQLCYGWSLSEGYLVSLGEAVGIIAAQSIGEPGTQLTMRTFHTGGVFAGEMFDQLISPYDGIIQYSSSIPGTLVRTTQGKIAFLTKVEGKLSIIEKNNSFLLSSSPNDQNSTTRMTAASNRTDPSRHAAKTFSHKSYKLPAYTLLFLRNNEIILKDQLIAELAFLSSKVKKKGEIAEFIVKSEIEGQLYSGSVNILEKYTDYNDIMTKSLDWGSVWILSGKICQLPVNSSFFALPGDLVDENAIVSQIQWVLPMKSLLDTNSLLKQKRKKEIYFDCNLNQNKWFQKRNLETLTTLFNLKFGSKEPIKKKNRIKKKFLTPFLLSEAESRKAAEKSNFFCEFQAPLLKNISSWDRIFFSSSSRKVLSYYPFAYLSKLKEKKFKLLSDFYPNLTLRENSKKASAQKGVFQSFEQISVNQEISLLFKLKIKTISDFTNVEKKSIFSLQRLKISTKNDTSPGAQYDRSDIFKIVGLKSQALKNEVVSPLLSFAQNPKLFPILPPFPLSSAAREKQNNCLLAGISSQIESQNLFDLKNKIHINLPLIFLCIDNIYYKKVGYFFSFKMRKKLGLNSKKKLSVFSSFSKPAFPRKMVSFKKKDWKDEIEKEQYQKQKKWKKEKAKKDKASLCLFPIFLSSLSAPLREKRTNFFFQSKAFHFSSICKDVFFVPTLLEQRNISFTKKKINFKQKNYISNQLLHWFPKTYLTMKGGICIYLLTHDFFSHYINFHSFSFLAEKKKGSQLTGKQLALLSRQLTPANISEGTASLGNVRGSQRSLEGKEQKGTFSPNLIENFDVGIKDSVSSNLLAKIFWVNQDYKKKKLYKLKFFFYSKFLEQLRAWPIKLKRQINKLTFTEKNKLNGKKLKKRTTRQDWPKNMSFRPYMFNLGTKTSLSLDSLFFTTLAFHRFLTSFGSLKKAGANNTFIHSLNNGNRETENAKRGIVNSFTIPRLAGFAAENGAASRQKKRSFSFQSFSSQTVLLSRQLAFPSVGFESSQYKTKYIKKYQDSSFSLNFYKNLTYYCSKKKNFKNLLSRKNSLIKDLDNRASSLVQREDSISSLFFPTQLTEQFSNSIFQIGGARFFCSQPGNNIFYATNKKKYSFFYLNKTNSIKKQLTNNSILNSFLYKPQKFLSAISLHKKFFLPGHKIIDDVSFDNFLIYVECIPSWRLSSLSKTLFSSRELTGFCHDQQRERVNMGNSQSEERKMGKRQSFALSFSHFSFFTLPHSRLEKKFNKKTCFKLKKLIINKMPRFIKTSQFLSNISNLSLENATFSRMFKRPNSSSFSPFVLLLTKVLEYPIYHPKYYKNLLYNSQKTTEQSFFHYSCKVKSKMLNKIFKNNYHSNVLNKQKSSLRLLEKFPNTDLVLALKCKGLQKDLIENFLKKPLNFYFRLKKQKSGTSANFFGAAKKLKKTEHFFLENWSKQKMLNREQKKRDSFSSRVKSLPFNASQEKKSNFFSHFGFNFIPKKSLKTENKLVEILSYGKKSLLKRTTKDKQAKSSLSFFYQPSFSIFFGKTFSKSLCMKFFSKSSIQLVELVLVGIQKNALNNKIIGLTVFNFFQKLKLQEDEKKRRQLLFFSHVARKKNSDFFFARSLESRAFKQNNYFSLQNGKKSPPFEIVREQKALLPDFRFHSNFHRSKINKTFNSKAFFLYFLDKKFKNPRRIKAKFVVSAFEKSTFSFDLLGKTKKKYFTRRKKPVSFFTTFHDENIKIMNNNISQSILQPCFYFNYDQKSPFGYSLSTNLNGPLPFSFSIFFPRKKSTLKNYFLFYKLLSIFNLMDSGKESEEKKEFKLFSSDFEKTIKAKVHQGKKRDLTKHYRRSNLSVWRSASYFSHSAFELDKWREPWSKTICSTAQLKDYEQSISYFSLISCFFQQPCFDAFFTQQVSFGYNEQKNVNQQNVNLSKKDWPFLRSKVYFKKDSLSEQGEIALTRYLSPFMGEILRHENYYWSQNTQKNRYLLLTKKDQISFFSNNYHTQKETSTNFPVGQINGKVNSFTDPSIGLKGDFFPLLQNKKNNLTLGEFLTKGECFTLKSQNSIISSESGLIIHSNKSKITLRKAQSFFLSPNCIFHYSHGDLVEKNKSILSLPYEQLKTGDIVQGIPKVEQLLEARSTFKGKEEEDNLHKLLRYVFELYKIKFNLKLSVRKSFSFIQLILVNSVQRIYRSQGVSISDKHLEVIVKQMTSKVQITSRGDSSFFRGEHVDLYIVETWNGLHPQVKKICYKPILLGISRSSLEVNSFLSAASFQHTKKVLSRSAFKTNIDFLNGLKENVIIGNLISAGTGNLNN
uniref:DNA-directed RNA polymerase subunit beta'' n=1 Tax=Stigeoclonium sp. FACHB-2425 TaxID=2730093 RepID=A0A6M3U968_9CHLO|nr:beta' subunit of RNA polymerase [Stigeoclonium sp. FACHB-2425]